MLNSRATRIASLVDRFIIWQSFNESVDGLWLGAFTSRAESVPVLSRVRAALNLIKSYDPHRYKRVLAQFDQILVGYIPSRGQFIPSLRRCALSVDFVAAAQVEEIAATIVHEATHGELFARGVGYNEDIRQRVENICTRQEIAFASRIPSPSAVKERAKVKLGLPADSWSNEMTAERSIEWLKADGCPVWVLSIVLAIRRWRQKREGKPRNIQTTRDA